MKKHNERFSYVVLGRNNEGGKVELHASKPDKIIEHINMFNDCKFDVYKIEKETSKNTILYPIKEKNIIEKNLAHFQAIKVVELLSLGINYNVSEKQKIMKTVKEKGLQVNFKIDHNSLSHIEYEIELNEPVVAFGVEHSLLRLYINKYTDEKEVFWAFYEDYDVAEDITAYFDTDWLSKKVKEIEQKEKIENHADFFFEHLIENEFYPVG